MKKITPLIILFSATFLNSFGQGQGNITQFASLNVSKPSDKNITGGGFGLNAGILYGLSNKLTIGGEAIGSLNVFGLKSDTEDTNFSLWYGGKVISEYYFTEGNFKPFAGAGLGLLKIGGINSSIDDTYSNVQFAFGPRAGILLGGFRLGFDYNIIPKKIISNQNVKYNLSTFGFTIGGQIGID